MRLAAPLAVVALLYTTPAAAQLRELEAQQRAEHPELFQPNPAVLLDPYVSAHLEAASLKHGWSGGFKVSGLSAVLGGALILAVGNDDTRPAAVGPLLVGGLFVLVGVLLDGAAAADYAAATQRLEGRW